MVKCSFKRKEIDMNLPVNSPFRYPGGKFYARRLILEHVPPHNYYIEPFAGGASIFFCKPKVKQNWLNDIDKDLINCYIHIRDYPERLIDFLKDIPADKEKHTYFKKEFRPKNKLERAGRWFYLNRTSYSGIMKPTNCFWGYGDKYSMRPENWPNHIRRCSNKLKKVKLTSFDFEKVISEAPKESFLFIDPPYYNSDQDKFYAFNFTHKDHSRLAAILKKYNKRFKFLLTYDNAVAVRELYSWSHVILEKEWNYTLNRTDDQSKKTSKKGSRYKGKEVFILNYKSDFQKDLFYSPSTVLNNSSAFDRGNHLLVGSQSFPEK